MGGWGPYHGRHLYIPIFIKVRDEVPADGYVDTRLRGSLVSPSRVGSNLQVTLSWRAPNGERRVCALNPGVVAVG